MAWFLNGTRPHVRAAGEEIGKKFNVGTIYGLGGRPGASDHPYGLALDFMTYNDMAKGQAITDYGYANAKRLAVKYIIWNRRIWNPSVSPNWRPYNGRSPHTDHPHFSFHATPGSGAVVETGGTPGAAAPGAATPIADLNPFDDVKNAVQNILKIFEAGEGFVRWITTGANWLRIGAFGVGVALLLTGLRKLVGLNIPVGGIGMVAKSAKKAAKAPSAPVPAAPKGSP